MEVHTEGLSTKKGGARVRGKWSAAKHGKGGVDCSHADWKQQYVLPHPDRKDMEDTRPLRPK